MRTQVLAEYPHSIYRVFPLVYAGLQVHEGLAVRICESQYMWNLNELVARLNTRGVYNRLNFELESLA